jgi:hypothetical protein
LEHRDPDGTVILLLEITKQIEVVVSGGENIAST